MTEAEQFPWWGGWARRRRRSRGFRLNGVDLLVAVGSGVFSWFLFQVSFPFFWIPAWVFFVFFVFCNVVRTTQRRYEMTWLVLFLLFGMVLVLISPERFSPVLLIGFGQALQFVVCGVAIARGHSLGIFSKTDLP